ncbi:MAG: type II CRISPR RNA-guided endonuclease Cas9 [Oscillospiraceae bacterium]|nr:type II CRISPR RNA-guided endonuclease Cas9 [Oscillospiraceae bacterium]
MHYKIGLDIGMASIGWSVLALDEQGEPMQILHMGSRVFEAAENPKDGSSLAKPRREARGIRRRLRRHVHRNERIRRLIVSRNILTHEALAKLFDGDLQDIYKLRTKGLDQLLAPGEFARVLIHLAQRRGFKSNRRADSKEGDAGKLLKAVEENQKLIGEGKKYRTVGEMLNSRPAGERKRNQGDYKNVVARDDVAHEVREIFKAQRYLGQAQADEETERLYLEILLSQRSFDQGPGGDSPYKVDFGALAGNCSLIEGEKRAPKSCYSFERFNLLQKVNHIRIHQSGRERPLTDAERHRLIDYAHEKATFNYGDIRKLLGLDPADMFNIRYGSDKAEDVEKKTKFNFLPCYHKIKSALSKIKKGRIVHFADRLDDIAYAMTITKDDGKLGEKLTELGLEMLDADALVAANSEKSFSKFGHISLKACRMINPHLDKGLTYNQACEAVGLDFQGYNRGKKSKFLHHHQIPELDGLTNPVVRRAVLQAIKVINSIINKMGSSPDFIGIELARELSKTKQERDRADKSMKDNQATNDLIKEQLQEYGVSAPKGYDIVKMKLWKEQDCICPYCLKPLKIEELFSGAGCPEVDHIVPYSISFDDSYKNKVVVCAVCNRTKGNRLPMQYLTGGVRDDFEIWVKNHIRDKVKCLRLLKEGLTEEDEGYKDRALNDTRYVCRLMLNILQNYLELAPPPPGVKKQIIAVNGGITAYIRKRWGISKIRADGDKHHAIDATVVACVTDGMIRKISRYAQRRELQYTQTEQGEFIVDTNTGEVLEDEKHFPQPYPHFRKELKARASSQSVQLIEQLKLPAYTNPAVEATPIFVSRMPRRKSTGAAHEATIHSSKMIDEGYILKSVPLTSLTLDKDGEIKDYYEKARQSDPKLYNALLDRLRAFDGIGGAAEAFKDGFILMGRDGHPPLKKVKIQEHSTLNVSVHDGKGVAKNESMIRIDVFHIPEGKDKGYYFIPVYVADTKKPQLPTHAVVAHKKQEDWKEMREEDFIFSVYPSELLKISFKKTTKFHLPKTSKNSSLSKEYMTQEELVYFISAHIGVGAIKVKTHDGAYVSEPGIKTLLLLEKYTVDVLGSISPAPKETRQGFGKKEG